MKEEKENRGNRLAQKEGQSAKAPVDLPFYT
jgi:hypothetical protein